MRTEVVSGISEETGNEKLRIRSRRAFIADSALEYFLSILVGGSFLATFTKHFGISDSIAGIIASTTTFTATFQLLSSSIRIKSSKLMVIIFGLVRSLILVGMYILPALGKNINNKAAIFVFAIVLSSVINDLSQPRKNRWMISLVNEKERGRFTANNSIFSLVTGMVFTYAMSAVNDHFKAIGRSEIAFVINGTVILTIAILQIICMLSSTDLKSDRRTEKSAFFKNIKTLLCDKNFMLITAMFTLTTVGTAISTSFFGTYYIGELGLSLRFISVSSIAATFARILASRFLGKYADRNSFARAVRIGSGFGVAAFAFGAIMVPANGAVMRTLFIVFEAVASASFVCSKVNMVYASVPEELRVDALAFSSCTGGILSFLSTLAISPLVEFIQRRGNMLFGIGIYAQQVTSIISIVFMAASLIIASYIIKKTEE